MKDGQVVTPAQVVPAIVAHVGNRADARRRCSRALFNVLRVVAGCTFMVTLVLPVGLVADHYRRHHVDAYCTGSTSAGNGYCHARSWSYCGPQSYAPRSCQWVDPDYYRRAVLACLCTQQLLMLALIISYVLCCMPSRDNTRPDANEDRAWFRVMMYSFMAANTMTSAFAFVYVQTRTVVLWCALCLFPIPIILGAVLGVLIAGAVLLGVGWLLGRVTMGVAEGLVGNRQTPPA